MNKHGFTIDDCNFHQNVDISTFENTKSVKIKPPEGKEKLNILKNLINKRSYL